MVFSHDLIVRSKLSVAQHKIGSYPRFRLCILRGALVDPYMISMNCPSCGKEIPENSKFCPSCGTKTGTSPAPLTVGTSNVFSGNEYIIEQKIAALRDTFGIKDRNGQLLAYVKKKLVSWGPQFYFEKPDGARFGEMRGKVLTVRPTFEIYDQQGLVAVVKKKVLKLLGSEWWLENSSGVEIGRIKGNITEHDFSIQSPKGDQIAQVHKKWASIRDSYGVEIQSQEIDSYIILAYVIAMDHAQFKLDKGLGVGFGLGGLPGTTNGF